MPTKGGKTRKRQGLLLTMTMLDTFPIVSGRMPLKFMPCSCLQISWACTKY